MDRVIKKIGRPRTERARKFEKLGNLIGCSKGQSYHFINGTRKASYDTGKLLDLVLGGSIALWCELGRSGIKIDLFKEW